jgi:uncharacterized Fe-S cluster protein YjdI
LVAVRKVYRGRDIEVSFDLDICIHVGECLRGERSVFMLERRPWVPLLVRGRLEVTRDRPIDRVIDPRGAPTS